MPQLIAQMFLLLSEDIPQTMDSQIPLGSPFGFHVAVSYIFALGVYETMRIMVEP